MASPLESMKSFFLANSAVVAFADAMNSFSERRAKLGLPNPGAVENLSREAQNNTLIPPGYMFSGIKGEITKLFGTSPFFQVSHQFSMEERNSPYTFSTLYGTNKVFLQGSVDNKGSLTSRFNYRWHDKFMTKTQMMLASEAAMREDMAQDMVQIENEYVGDDFTASLKMVNASVLSGGLSGIFMGSYLQSVTPRLGLGFETIWQRSGLSQPPDTGVSLCAKYKADDWIATTLLQSQGVLSATYWRRIAENVQAGADLTLAMVPPSMVGPGGPTKEGRTTVGVKYDFKASSLRTQIDSKGKISLLVEKRVGQVMMMTFATEVDHFSQQAKVGVGVAVEIPTEEVLAQQQQEAMGGQAAGANIPF